MEKARICLLVSTLFIFLAACGAGDADGELDTIEFVGGDWDSLMIHNTIAQKIIEEGYGYDTDTTLGSTAAVFEGLRQGELHVLMEAWTYTMKDVYEKALESGDVKKIGLNFDDNTSGFHVPTYIIEGDDERGIDPVAPDLETVADLDNYPDVFENREDPTKGIIYNGPSGWEMSKLVEEKFNAYDLGEKYTLFGAGSEAGLNASLESAYESGEPWVGYTWSPTVTTAKFDLTLLEEPEYDEDEWEKTRKTKLPPENVEIAVHKDFPDQAPEIVEFLENYHTSEKLTEAGLKYMLENDVSPEEAGIWWLQEYEDVWTEWVPDDIAEKVKESLF